MFAEHSQPWTFSSEAVSENAKGWLGDERQGSSSIQQFTLTPDSLAFERDTTLAPLSPGHAVRVGVSWEGHPMGGGVRARRCRDLLGDPLGGRSVHQVTQLLGWRQMRRTRFSAKPCGGQGCGWSWAWCWIWESYPSARSAAQFRVDAFWLPGSIGGLFLSLVMSPTG